MNFAEFLIIPFTEHLQIRRNIISVILLNMLIFFSLTEDSDTVNLSCYGK